MIVQGFTEMPLDTFRQKLKREPSPFDGRELYWCPMCGTSTPIEGMRERYAAHFQVDEDSLAATDDAELIYRSCLATYKCSAQ